MKTAIDDLILATADSTSPLRLHILKKSGADSADLKGALEAYKLLNPQVRSRVEILIQAYDIGPL